MRLDTVIKYMLFKVFVLLFGNILVVSYILFFFFFKQKTAYEIS